MVGFLFVLGCLTAATLFIYWYFLAPPYWDKTFGQLDERFYFAPQAFFLDVSLQKGEFPLWNPLAYGGMPFAADPQASACYPPHLIRSLLTPSFDPFATAVSLHLLRFLHLLWAGLGVVCLARLYRLSLPACLVGALAFMFNMFNIIYFTEFYVYSLLVVWVPWVLWAAKKAFQSQSLRNSIAFAILAALFFALSTLAGFPQLSLYLGLSLGFYGLFDFLLNCRFKFKFTEIVRAFSWRMGLIAGIGIFTVLASFVLLLPAIELGSGSARVVASGVEVSTIKQNFEALHLLKCWLFYPGNTWLPFGPRAVGIGSILVALTAFIHRKRWRDAMVFFLLYLVLTDCSLGPPFPVGALLHRFDILNITVSPWRAGSFAALPFALLVAFGIDAAGQRPVRCWLRSARMLVLAAAGAGMLYMLYHWLQEDVLQQEWRFVWAVPLVTLVAVCLFSWLPRAAPGRWIIAILVVMEILLWSSQILPAYVSKRVTLKMDTSTFTEHRDISTLNRRNATVRPNWNMFTLDFTMAGYNPLYVGKTRETLCRLGYENFYRGYLNIVDVTAENQRGNLFMKRSFWLARQWVAGILPDKRLLFPAATTVFLNDMTADKEELSVPEVSRTSLKESAVSDEVERIDLGVPDPTKANSRSAKIELRLASFEQNFKHSTLCISYQGTGVVEFTPRCRDELGRSYSLKRSRTIHTHGAERTLEIPLPDCGTNTVTLIYPSASASKIQFTGAYVLKDTLDENQHIEIEKYTANTVSVKLKDLPEPRVLTFLDSWYSGWRAWIDGEEVNILKANDAFKAVVVPAGTHTVAFTFQPMSFYIGLITSLVFFGALFIVLIGIVIVSCKKKISFCIRKRAKKQTIQDGTLFEQVELHSGQHIMKVKKIVLLLFVLLVIGITLLAGAIVTKKSPCRLFSRSKENREEIVLNKPIEVSSITTLQNIGLQPDLPLNGDYLLTRDIDAFETVTWYGGSGFKPIGTLEKPFVGSLDGQGHCIHNLFINLPDTDNVGLFGVVAENASITEIHLVDAQVTGYFNVGSLIGNNCGSVSKCSGSGYIVGEAYLGGLLGANAGEVTRCYAVTAVAGDSRLGALAGLNTGSIEECYGGGKILGKAYCGGLIGRNQRGSVTSSFWDIAGTGLKLSEGGIGHETSVMMTKRPYVESGWDFTNTWEIDEGNTYPQFVARPKKESDSMPSAIEINSIEQFQRIGRDKNFPLNGTYILSADLDARATATWDQGRGFEPIGAIAGRKSSLPFTGHIDGRGHVIAGLVIHRPESNGVGLFAEVGKDARIVNLGLQDISVTGKNSVGGLVGHNYGSVFSCFTNGKSIGNAYIGGLIGIQNGRVQRCYAMGSVKGDSRVGGLVGMNQGNIFESFSAADVAGSSLTGALVGRNYSSGTVAENCFWDRTVYAVNLPGDSAGRLTSELYQQATYTLKAWDFFHVWKITEGKSYPSLRVFP